MLSGGQAGLISVEVLREEQEENRRRERKNQPLEGWISDFFLFTINFTIAVVCIAQLISHITHAYSQIAVLRDK